MDCVPRHQRASVVQGGGRNYHVRIHWGLPQTAASHPQIGRSLQDLVEDRQHQRVLAEHLEPGQLRVSILFFQAAEQFIAGDGRNGELPMLREVVGCVSAACRMAFSFFCLRTSFRVSVSSKAASMCYSAGRLRSARWRTVCSIAAISSSERPL